MSNQVYDWPSTKKLYTGVSGSGKTSLFWEHWTREKARVKFLYDHKAMEFSNRYLDVLPCLTAEALLERTEKAIHSRRGETVAFSPSEMFDGDTEQGFEFFCEFVFKASELFKGRKLFGTDELQDLVGTASKPKPLLRLCDIGRTYQIDCFFIASASNSIHNRVRGQLTECFAFLHGDEAACEWEKSKGFNSNELLTLKKGEYGWRHLHTGEARKGGKAF